MICNWYGKLFVNVWWNGSLSKIFIVGSGVSQGSILSPTLFNLFINLFIVRLKSSGIGCHSNSVFYGCFLYADDIIILSPSVCGLQVMLDNCYHTCTLLSLRFNHLKSHCIIFGKSYKLSMQPMMLGFNCIQWVDCMKYLGVHACSGKNLPFDIDLFMRSATVYILVLRVLVLYHTNSCLE